ncbi:hypothetical protein SAMN04488587_0198 [Methanococcoides vulcani]|uniref:Wadjet protein JetD C-terminal domain-containing protein n=1 Tax=Methanococcoides vulcani TaxID=1353158 RepID=A0A1H9Y3L0_9EURY|nr:Wadjet anti-phage system protein JetD domain-containing protein [Methanococcoides vulcani]SES63251.1 hypothetical protein SAMN04488587_0198 [Methanococcoides vulcani]
MEALIRNIIEQHKKKKKKTIETKYIVSELKALGTNLYSDSSLAKPFAAAMQKLVDDGAVKPFGNSSSIPQYGGAMSKYYINVNYFESDDDILPSSVLNDLHPKLNMSYYVKHASEYYELEGIIHRINDILFDNDSEILTANERSYLIFGDEKAIMYPADASIDGADILKKLGRLTLEDIKAKRTFEPFFYLATSGYHNLTEKRNVLIVENQDTFNTFMDAVMEGQLPDVHLLIYGEGNAITRKFEFIQSIHGKLDDNYYYFGDIDPVGISIYHRLKSTFPDYNIIPAVSLYSYMINKVNPADARKLRKPQKVDDTSVSQFIATFDTETGMVIKDIVYSERYLPQEVINKTDMVRLNGIGIH